MSSKSQNRVKISNFLTILGITRKVIIIEEWTKNLKNLVLSNGYISKKITNIKNKCATARRSSPIGPLMTWRGGGGHTAVVILRRLYYGYTMVILRSDFGKTRTWQFYSWIAQKSPPGTPSDFWQQALVHKGLIEYCFKFGENCSPPKKTKIKNGGGKKFFFFYVFLTSKTFVFKLFLLVSRVNLFKVYCKKRKSWEKKF